MDVTALHADIRTPCTCPVKCLEELIETIPFTRPAAPEQTGEP
jgi:hypothetical protein